MGYPQMFALIGSIVLFTSVVLTMNTSINNQRQIVYQSIYMNQAVKLASKVFDKITVETKTDLIDFDDIAITYSGTDSLRIWGNDVWYIYNVSSHYCDSSGVDAAGRSIGPDMRLEPAAIEQPPQDWELRVRLTCRCIDLRHVIQDDIGA